MTKLNPYAWFAQRFVLGFYLAVFAAAAGIGIGMVVLAIRLIRHLLP